MDNETKLTTYNTFTFKSEAEMLLHINYWDDEGEKAFKMYTFFKNLVIILFLFLPLPLLAVTKSDSQYIDKQLIEHSKQVGEWMWVAQKCNYGEKYRIGNEVAKLSWEDYKAYRSGLMRYGNYVINQSVCSKEKEKITQIKNEYINELQSLVKSIVSIK